MTVIRSEAIVCTVRRHGEHGAVVRLMTPDHGLQAGYVRGGRSTALRPVLLPANRVQAELRSRSADQLAGLTVELAQSRAPFFAEPLAAAAFGWACALTGAVPPEGQPYPRLYAALAALLDLICAAPSVRWWARRMIDYELLLLAELGFGLELDRCAVTGARDDLAFVSPRSGRAVSQAAAGHYAERLLELPQFLATQQGDLEPDWPAILTGFALTEPFLDRAFLQGRRDDLAGARLLLVERLKRMVA